MDAETILNALPLPVIVCDRHGAVLIANEAVDLILGHPLDKSVPLSLRIDGGDLLSPPDHNQARKRVDLKTTDGSILLSVPALLSPAHFGDELVTVALLQPEPLRSVPKPARGGIKTGARLLVVDDEEMVRMVIVAVLVQNGYDVVEAVDGEDALRQCSAGRFDLALVDLCMPRLNGLETLKRLRAVQPNLKGLLLSGVADIGESARGEDLTGLHFLQKPFDNSELTQTVARLLAEPVHTR